MEKEFRGHLRARGLKLSSLRLRDAFEAMLDFWNTDSGLEVLPTDGDALVAYEDITDNGRGTHLELGFIRLIRTPLKSDSDSFGPAYRLRLRLCYKWDMDVITDVLPQGTWSLACWDSSDKDNFRQAVIGTIAFATMQSKAPAEVNVTLEHAAYPPARYRPDDECRQMWWGVCNVA